MHKIPNAKKKTSFVISIILCISIMLSYASITFAAEQKEENNDYQLDDVVFYVTRIDNEQLGKYYSEKSGVYELNQLLSDAKDGVLPLNSKVYKYDYKDIKESEDPILSNAIQKVIQTKDRGYQVDSINIILPYDDQEINNQNGMVFGNGDPGSIEYWRSVSTYWTTYLGQDVRYYLHSVSVSRPKASVNGNRPNTWNNILNAFVNVVTERFIEQTYFDTVYSIISDIRTILNSATPQNIVFDNTTEWIKSETEGTLTYKEILLEDINNVTPGFLFSIWGTVEQLAFQSRFEIKYYNGYVNGTPSYPIWTSQYYPLQYVSSRFFNEAFYLIPIVRNHYDSSGYIYTESVDLQEMRFR